MVDISTQSQLKKEQQEEEEQQQQHRRTTPTIYRVTTGSLSEQTKKTYQCHINDFLAFYKITDLSGIEPLKKYSPKLIRQMVLDYVFYLRHKKPGRKLSRSSIKNYCAALSRFFYEIRDDDTRLNWTKVRDEFPPDERICRDRAYKVEEIQIMISNGCAGRRREKAFILLLTSTGMRIGGIHTLKYGDLVLKTITQGGRNKRVYQVEVYSASSAHYYCYCNVETAQAIDEYLKERTDKGEILQNNSPLFRDLKTLNVRNVKPITSYDVKYLVGKVVERSGVKKTFQFTGEAKSSKGLRKYYKSSAELAGMKPINVELTHGHSVGIAGHYYRPNESDVLNDYVTHAEGTLTFDNKQRLKQENQELKSINSQGLDKLKKEVQALKEFVYSGPRPRNEEMRKTYYKGLKDYYKGLKDYYKEKKGIDIDVPKHLLPDYCFDD